MSNRLSVGLMLLGLAWAHPAGAQVTAQDSRSWSLSVREGHLTAKLNRVPLRTVLEELARQAPLRLTVREQWPDHPVTALFRSLPLDEALAKLLAGLPYAIIYAPASVHPEPSATRRIVEVLIFEHASTANAVGSSAASAARSAGGVQPQGPSLHTTAEWSAVLEHPDTEIRLDALQRWAEQGAATPLDPLMQALSDPDESVRAMAEELVERVTAAKREASNR